MSFGSEYVTSFFNKKISSGLLIPGKWNPIMYLYCMVMVVWAASYWNEALGEGIEFSAIQHSSRDDAMVLKVVLI